MKLLRYIYVLMFLTCCVMTTAYASTLQLTLDDAIALAKRQNLNLQSQMIDVQQARRDVDTSWNLFLPTVNLTLSHGGQNDVFSNSGVKVISGLRAGLSVEFPLNLAVKDQLDSYNLAYSIQQVTYAQAQAEIERNVTKLFYYLLAESENLALQQKNLELAEKQYEKVRINYESGFASELEMLSSRLGVDQLRPSFHQSQNTYEAQMLALKALLGVDFDTELLLEGTLPNWSLEETLDELRGQIGSTRTMQLFALQAASIESGKLAQGKAALTPTLMISAGYSIDTKAISPAPSFVPTPNVWSDVAQYSISLVVPLDSHIPGSSTKVSLEKMDNSLRKLNFEREQTRMQLEQSVITQVRTLENLQKQREVAQSNLELAQRVYEMHLIQYEGGYVDYLSVENAQQDVFSAEQNLLFLDYQYASALVDLAYDIQLDLN